MSEQLNKKIHEWLGKCWHEFNNDCICQKKGCHADNSFFNRNPNYASEAIDCLALIEAVRVKGYTLKLYVTQTGDPSAVISSWNSESMAKAYGRTLPEAVAKAVEKLIDAEVNAQD